MDGSIAPFEVRRETDEEIGEEAYSERKKESRQDRRSQAKNH
jgi:hypothetical protein